MASDFKVKAFVIQSLVFAAIESIQTCSAVRDVCFPLVEFYEQIHPENLLSKIAFIEWASENCFVEMLQLPQRKLLGKQLEADRLVTNFAAQPFRSEVEDVLVIKCELR